MKIKKIYIGLFSLFLALCLILAFQVLSEKNEDGEQLILKEAIGQEAPFSEEVLINETETSDVILSISDEPESPDSILNTSDNLQENAANIEPIEKPYPAGLIEDDTEKSSQLKCTLSVTCTTVLDNMDILNPEKKEIVPEDGIIFQEQEVVFYEGDSVFDVLLREMKNNKIHMEYVMTPLYDSNYIEGIGNLYELDCGELSGWVYLVNGLSPSYGSSSYKLSDGDVVEWKYTCNLGRDVGAENIKEDIDVKNGE
ncbi:MAG: hypothetical protein K0Q47_456 [Sedimentibacter sp.]|jgi:hypothetical protein|nr:hypothetical protein [Sedimentibacter sp.]